MSSLRPGSHCQSAAFWRNFAPLFVVVSVPSTSNTMSKKSVRRQFIVDPPEIHQSHLALPCDEDACSDPPESGPESAYCVAVCRSQFHRSSKVLPLPASPVPAVKVSLLVCG